MGATRSRHGGSIRDVRKQPHLHHQCAVDGGTLWNRDCLRQDVLNKRAAVWGDTLSCVLGRWTLRSFLMRPPRGHESM